jgi:hypothetical protein
MAYNLAKYNLARYNVHSAGVRMLRTRRDLVQSFECVAGAKRYGKHYRTAVLSLHASVKLRARLKAAERINELNILNAATLAMRLRIPRTIEQIFSGYSHLGKIISNARIPTQAINGLWHVGAILHRNKSTRQAFYCDLNVGMRVLRSDFIAQYILCDINAFAVVMITGEIDITLHPGDELRIDSGDYTAFYYPSGQSDPVNVLDKYRGEWIFITPETLEIIISTGNNAPITGEIIYKEPILSFHTVPYDVIKPCKYAFITLLSCHIFPYFVPIFQRFSYLLAHNLAHKKSPQGLICCLLHGVGLLVIAAKIVPIFPIAAARRSAKLCA